MHPLPTLQDLDPFHLQQLRLSLSNSLRRLPSDEELEDGIKPWLKREYKALEQQENERAQAAKLRAEKREQLDLAWEWQRQAEESAGMRRTTQQRAEDAKVFARLEERRRAKEQARLEQEAKQWEAALGVTPKTREGRDQRREGDRARLEQSAERDKNGKPAPEWLKHRQTLQKQFPTGWAPPKRISREAMDLIRSLHGSDPERYSTPVLSARFKISPEAVRRVLRSKFEHTVEEKARREAQRKEDRIRQIKEGASAGELQWEGNLAAQKREQDELRRKAEAR
ncbi:Required for respiratory growth protein 9 mitochondrial [Rhodosporidiobolus nylandii]